MQENIYYIKRKIPQKSPGKRLFKMVFLLSVCAFFGYRLFTQFSVESKDVLLSPLAQEIINKTVAIINPDKDSEHLTEIVTQTLVKDKDDYGVVIKNLKTGEKLRLNEDKVFDTASIYKLWIMAVSYQQMEKHELNKTDILSDTLVSLNKKFNFASNSAELEDQVVTWPVQNALEQAITISDNYSALLLTEKIKLSNVTAFLSENGLNGSKVGTLNENPVTTAHDVGLFLEKLYKGELANNQDTKEMLDLLKRQQINNKLPSELPENVVIAHKTGELDEFSHDAGIVYTQSGNYIIVVLSKTEAPFSANLKIAEISKKIYAYFFRK